VTDLTIQEHLSLDPRNLITLGDLVDLAEDKLNSQRAEILRLQAELEILRHLKNRRALG